MRSGLLAAAYHHDQGNQKQRQRKDMGVDVGDMKGRLPGGA